MFERFTDAARQAVAAAEEESRDLNSGYIGTEHLLIAVAAERQGLGGRILRDLGAAPDDLRDDARRHAGPSAIDPDALATLGIDFDEVKRRVEKTFGPGALARGRECKGHVPFAPAAKKSLELSLRSALSLGDKFIGSEHILLGVARADNGMAAQILRERGIDVKRLEAAVVEARRAA
jgi:ATP-dependent Clp protease ATP-binding subunit ClpA